MELINQAGIVPRLKSLNRSGVILYGGSAGAIIMGDSIKTDPESKNHLPALSLLNPDTLVACHFDPGDTPRMKILQQMSADCHIIAIPEESGVLYRNGLYRVVGTLPISVFQSESVRQYSPPESFTFKPDR